MDQPLITLTTDFGLSGSYVGQMKGVILSLAQGATIVDISHGIEPQNVRQGALVLAEAAPRFPPGTIHVAVVDPGVGTGRSIVCLELAGQVYIAPDNGLLSGLLAGKLGEAKAYEVSQTKFFLQPVSATFHGRDIMAPVAAHLSLGTAPAELGPPLSPDKLVWLDWPQPLVEPNRLRGSVQVIDSFGNLVTNLQADLLPGEPADYVVRCGQAEIKGLLRTYGEATVGELVALVGSCGTLEVALVGGSAAASLTAEVGQPVEVCW